MSHLLANVEPKVMWDHFYKLTQIPRPSKNEAAVCHYIVNLAKELGYDVRMDQAGGEDFGNIVVKVPPTPGHEDAPIVVIQSHVDIVALPETMRDQPLDLILDGTILRANGSTLGADNGIAVAMALTLMPENDIEHGPLELLFTIDEETGMTGAKNLAPDFLDGQFLINIDSEEDGTLTVGCAGGNRTRLHLAMVTENVPDNAACVRIEVSGLKGGHSGIEINSGRANAGRLLARLLFEETKRLDLHLSGIEWGSVDNAIPSEASAVVFVKMEQLADLKGRLQHWTDTYRQEFGRHDPNIAITLDETIDKPDFVYTKRTMSIALGLLLSLPHGVAKMSSDIDGLVETSANLAIVRSSREAIEISLSQRSSIGPSLDGIITQCEACASLAGATVEHGSRYYGWQPNMDSRLLQICKQVYEEMFDKSPNVVALHAGLECGLIGATYPNLDMISIGPTILDAHAPTKSDFQPGVDSNTRGERIDTAQMPHFWEFFKNTLKRLAQEKAA